MSTTQHKIPHATRDAPTVTHEVHSQAEARRPRARPGGQRRAHGRGQPRLRRLLQRRAHGRDDRQACLLVRRVPLSPRTGRLKGRTVGGEGLPADAVAADRRGAAGRRPPPRLRRRPPPPEHDLAGRLPPRLAGQRPARRQFQRERSHRRLRHSRAFGEWRLHPPGRSHGECPHQRLRAGPGAHRHVRRHPQRARRGLVARCAAAADHHHLRQGAAGEADADARRPVARRRPHPSHHPAAARPRRRRPVASRPPRPHRAASRTPRRRRSRARRRAHRQSPRPATRRCRRRRRPGPQEPAVS